MLTLCPLSGNLENKRVSIVMERIKRIIQWVFVILATVLIFYLVITEERLAPEGWGFNPW